MLVRIGDQWWQRPYRLSEAHVEVQPTEWIERELDKLGVKYSRFAKRHELVNLLKKEYDVIVAKMKVEQDEAIARGELKRLEQIPNPNKPKHRKAENLAVAGDMKAIRGRIRNLSEGPTFGSITLRAPDGSELIVTKAGTQDHQIWSVPGSDLLTDRKQLYPIITEWLNHHVGT